MNELRWILLGFGIALLAGIYLWGRRLRPRAASEARAFVPQSERVEPDYRELESPAHLRNTGNSAEASGLDADDNETEPLDDDETAAADAARMNPASPSPGILAARRSSVEIDDADVSAPLGSTRLHEPLLEVPPQAQRSRREPRLGPFAAKADDAAVVLSTRRAEPSVGGLDSARRQAMRAELSADPRDEAKTDRPAAAEVGKRILAVRLVAPVGQRYPGGTLLDALLREHLQHGRYGIFHSVHESGENVFSVASMVEPGSFDLDAMHAGEFPGLTLFTVVPGPRPGAEAVAAMIACAGRLQQTLGGALQDERGMPLAQARLEAMRSEASMVTAGAPASTAPSTSQ